MTHRNFQAAIGAGGISLVVFAAWVVAVPLHDRPFGLDSEWHDFLAAHQIPLLEAIAVTLHRVGGTVGMTIVTALVVVGLFIARRPTPAISIAVAVALAAGLCALLKMAVSRPRPADAVIDIVSDSFPSGHTTTAAALVVTIAVLVRRHWVWMLAVSWVIVMAASRTYLHVHWLSDVAAGAVLGASVALVTTAVVDALAQRRRFLREPSPDRASISASPQGDSATVSS